MDKIEPAEPIGRIAPLDPMLKMEAEDPGPRDEPAEIRITTFWQAPGASRLTGVGGSTPAAGWADRATVMGELFKDVIRGV